MKDLKKEIDWKIRFETLTRTETGKYPKIHLLITEYELNNLLLAERKKTLEEVWGVINEKLDTLDINTQEQEVNVLVWLNKKIDVAITRLSKLLKEGNEKE